MLENLDSLSRFQCHLRNSSSCMVFSSQESTLQTSPCNILYVGNHSFKYLRGKEFGRCCTFLAEMMEKYGLEVLRDIAVELQLDLETLY